MANDVWLKDLWDLICELYKMWGGDCKDLPPRPQTQALVAYMWGVFNSLGPPDVSGPGQQARLMKLLSDLEKLLEEPDKDIDAATEASLIAWINAVRNSVKP